MWEAQKCNKNGNDEKNPIFLEGSSAISELKCRVIRLLLSRLIKLEMEMDVVGVDDTFCKTKASDFCPWCLLVLHLHSSLCCFCPLGKRERENRLNF